MRVEGVLWTGRLIRADAVRRDMTGQTELCNTTRDQQSWIRRAVRGMTGNATFGLNRRMLVLFTVAEYAALRVVYP